MDMWFHNVTYLTLRDSAKVSSSNEPGTGAIVSAAFVFFSSVSYECNHSSFVFKWTSGSGSSPVSGFLHSSEYISATIAICKICDSSKLTPSGFSFLYVNTFEQKLRLQVYCPHTRFHNGLAQLVRLCLTNIWLRQHHRYLQNMWRITAHSYWLLFLTGVNTFEKRWDCVLPSSFVGFVPKCMVCPLAPSPDELLIIAARVKIQH